MMRYIVVCDGINKENEFLYDIADYFWNSGNEVFVRDWKNKIDYSDISENDYCTVLFIPDICFDQCLFRANKVRIHSYLELEISQDGRPLLVFSANGVYSNAIPYPHKIFRFEKLTRGEIVRFFNWRSKFLSIF